MLQVTKTINKSQNYLKKKSEIEPAKSAKYYKSKEINDCLKQRAQRWSQQTAEEDNLFVLKTVLTSQLMDQGTINIRVTGRPSWRLKPRTKLTN